MKTFENPKGKIRDDCGLNSNVQKDVFQFGFAWSGLAIPLAGEAKPWVLGTLGTLASCGFGAASDRTSGEDLDHRGNS